MVYFDRKKKCLATIVTTHPDDGAYYIVESLDESGETTAEISYAESQHLIPVGLWDDIFPAVDGPLSEREKKFFK